MSQDEYFGPLILDPIQVLRVNAFNDQVVAIKTLGEILPLMQWEVAGEFRRRTKQAFEEEGIEFALPHRTLYWGAGEETHMGAIERNAIQKHGEQEVVLAQSPKEQGDNTYTQGDSEQN